MDKQFAKYCFLFYYEGSVEGSVEVVREPVLSGGPRTGGQRFRVTLRVAPDGRANFTGVVWTGSEITERKDRETERKDSLESRRNEIFSFNGRHFRVE